MTQQNLREFFESDYPGIEAIREKLIAPLWKGCGSPNKPIDLSEQDKGKIKSITIFANQGSEINFVDVEISDSVVLRHNRATINRYIAKSILDAYQSTLIFFHYKDTSREWRISYAYKGAGGKDYTNPKRYTYLCGKDAHCRTAAERFAALEKAGGFPDSDAMMSAFSVETLTKEFFDQLFKWYDEWACKVALFPSKNCIASHAELTAEDNQLHLIRLITRLMFVWFIKQKDLVPEWIFDRSDLERILSDGDLDSEKKGSYYNAVLQNLFFGALNKKIQDRTFAERSVDGVPNEQYGIKALFRDDNKKSFFTESHAEMTKRFEGVPFLNGGLFECLDYDVPHGKDSHKVHYVDGFSRNADRRAFVPNALFWSEDESHLGLIPLLRRYNFTAEESTPSDIQVALDPELLGKIFENLLGTYNPETKESARKESGSFYTPREIVSYMVNRSLISYLHEKVPSISEAQIENLVENLEFSKENLEFSKENLIENKDLRGFDSLAKSDGFDSGNLSTDETFAERRTVFPARPNETSGSIDSLEHSGGIWKTEPKGISQISSNSTRFCNGTGNSDKDLQKNQLSDRGTDKEFIRTAHGNSKNDNGSNENSKLNSNSYILNSIRTALHSIKIIDPACGSGAFPMGILNKLVELHGVLNRMQGIADENLYTLKTRIIEDSIFGVDIQPIAVQICKLRFFISLICEQPKTGSIENNYGYNPLPNLETKFVAANTLIGKAKNADANSLFANPKIDEIAKELGEIRKTHFGAKTAREKKENREKDEALRKELSKLLEEDKVYSPDDARQLAAWNPYDQTAPASTFFDAEWMFGVKDGFDIVIGNPPYVQVKKGIVTKEQYPYSEGKDVGKQNLYKLFVEASYNFLKDNGVSTLIVQSSLMCDMSSAHTRELLLTKTQLLNVIEFPKVAPNKDEQVFKSVLQGTCIAIFVKRIPNVASKFGISINNDRSTIKSLKFELVNQFDLKNYFSSRFEIPLIKTGEMKIISKIKVFPKLQEIITDSLQGNINTIHLSEIKSDKKTDIFIAKGANVHKYYIDDDVFFGKNSAQVKSLVQRNFNAGAVIVTQNITGTTDKFRIHAAYAECKNTNFVFLHSVNIAYLPNPSFAKFVLALLNSRLLDWLFRKTSTNNHCNMYELVDLPIPSASSEQQKPIIDLVDKILVAKKATPSADSSADERKIDLLVYHLYGLTFDEAKVIDESLTEEEFNAGAGER